MKLKTKETCEELEKFRSILDQSEEYIDWKAGQTKAILDGCFTQDELTALVRLMAYEKRGNQK